MPNVSVYDTEQRATVSVPAEQVEVGVKSGKYVKTAESVVRQDVNGTDVSRDVSETPALDLGGARYGTGYQEAADERAKATQEALTSWDSKANVFAEGIIDAATFGIVRSHDESDIAAREANPGMALAGNVIGGVASMGTSVGKSLVKGGEFAGKSFARALIKQGEGRLARAGARAVEEAATGAVITGTMATTHQLGDAIIENKPLSAAAWAHEVGLGTLLAGGIGAVAGGLSRAGGPATKAAVKGQGGLLDAASADSVAVHSAVEDTIGKYGDQLEALANKHGIMRAIDQETGLLSKGAMAERGKALAEAGKAFENLKAIKFDKSLDTEAAFAKWQKAHDSFYEKFQAVDDQMRITPGEAESYQLVNQRDIHDFLGEQGMKPTRLNERPIQRSPGHAPETLPEGEHTAMAGEADVGMVSKQAEFDQAELGQFGPQEEYRRIYGEDWQPATREKLTGDMAEQVKSDAPSTQDATNPGKRVRPVQTPEATGQAFQDFFERQVNKIEPQLGHDGSWKPELVGIKERQQGRMADRYRSTERMDAVSPLDELSKYADDATGDVSGFLRNRDNQRVLAGLNGRSGKVLFSPMDRELAGEGYATIKAMRGSDKGNSLAKQAIEARMIEPSMAEVDALKNRPATPKDTISELVAERKLARKTVSMPAEAGPGFVGSGAPKTELSMAAQENAALDASARDTQVSPKMRETRTTPSRAAQENAALDASHAKELAASYDNDSISGMIGKRRQAAANREPMPEPTQPAQAPHRKPETATLRWMEDWYNQSKEMGPRLSPFHKASEHARQAVEAINGKFGARLDAAGGLNPQELFGLPRSTTALGERMQQLFTLRQAGKMVADASRGGKVSAAAKASASSWVTRNLAGRVGSKLMGGIMGGALGGPIGFAIGASMMADGAGSLGRIAGAAGRLTQKIGEATSKLLSGRVGKALAPAITNQAFAYDADGPIKDEATRIEKISQLAANPDAVRQKVMASMGDMAYISPELAQAAADHAVNKIQMLKMRAPMFVWDAMGQPMKPSENKMRVFREYEQAANNLDVILDSMKSGRLTRCQADALRECWPEAHSEIIKPLLTHKDKYSKLDEPGKRSIELVLGGPVFSNPGDVVRHQQMWMQANQQAPSQQLAGSPSGGKPQALNISETPAQSSMAPGNR